MALLPNACRMSIGSMPQITNTQHKNYTGRKSNRMQVMRYWQKTMCVIFVILIEWWGRKKERESRGRCDGDLFFSIWGSASSPSLLVLYVVEVHGLKFTYFSFKLALLVIYLCQSEFEPKIEHYLGSGTCHYWSWMTVPAQERTQASFYHY